MSKLARIGHLYGSIGEGGSAVTTTGGNSERLPFAPLEEAIGAQLGRKPSNQDLMIVLGVLSEPAIPQYRRRGLSIWQADRFAIMIDKHPIEIWGITAWIGGGDCE